MVARTNKRTVKKGLELSKIFGDLPDMLKQQVLEFAAPVKDLFFFGYSPKTKTFVKQINKSFMKDMLEYKINNPPVRTEIGDHFIQIKVSPPKIPFYEEDFNNDPIVFGYYSIIFVHSKYFKLRTLLKNDCIKNNKIFMNPTNVINNIGIVYSF
jgi:hypothetical protein